MKLELKFKIGERVKVPELGVEGRIKAIFIDSSGPQFRVRYFESKKSEETYFLEDEILKLDAPDNKKNIGYK